MATVIKARDLPALEATALRKPFIYCDPDPGIVSRAVSLNVQLAKKLAALKPNRRSFRMEQCFLQVLAALPDDVFIRDFDVMFNPDYEVDVLRILCSAAKARPFRVLWPGRWDNGRLIYAEEGYRDYRVFEAGLYDLTVII